MCLEADVPFYALARYRPISGSQFFRWDRTYDVRTLLPETLTYGGVDYRVIGVRPLSGVDVGDFDPTFAILAEQV